MNRVTSTRLLRNIVNNVEEGVFMKYNAKAHRELPKRPFIFIRNRHMARVHSAARLLGGLLFLLSLYFNNSMTVSLLNT